MLLFAVAGMFAAILVAVVVFLSAGDDRREVRLALRGLADYDLPANVREQEMLKSIQERVLVPFMAMIFAREDFERVHRSRTGLEARVAKDRIGSPAAGFSPEFFVALLNSNF